MQLAVAYPRTSFPLTAPSDEWANCATHGTGLALSVAGLHRLLLAAAGHGTVMQVAGTAIFGSSLVLAYFASTAYHAVRSPRLKSVFRTLDHSAIYVLIAGTYTPFLLALPAPWPGHVLAVIWCLAGFGVALKAVGGASSSVLSTVSYLAIGWIGVFAITPLMEHLSARAVAWLVAGGLAYTLGLYFFLRSNVKYCHAIWHLFVVAGSAMHYGAVILYVVPSVR